MYLETVHRRHDRRTRAHTRIPGDTTSDVIEVRAYSRRHAETSVDRLALDGRFTTRTVEIQTLEQTVTTAARTAERRPSPLLFLFARRTLAQHKLATCTHNNNSQRVSGSLASCSQIIVSSSHAVSACGRTLGNHARPPRSASRKAFPPNGSRRPPLSYSQPPNSVASALHNATGAACLCRSRMSNTRVHAVPAVAHSSAARIGRARRPLRDLMPTLGKALLSKPSSRVRRSIGGFLRRPGADAAPLGTSFGSLAGA